MPFRRLRPEPWDDSLPGIRSRRLLRSREADLILYRIQPGILFPAHSHADAQMGLVLEGGGLQRANGEITRLTPGDSYYTPPYIPHEFETVSRGTTVIVDVELHPSIGAGADSRRGHVLLQRAAWEYLRESARARESALPVELPALDPVSEETA